MKRLLIFCFLLFFSQSFCLMEKSSNIFVCGHNGLVGKAITSLLKEKGYENIITKTSKELDLRNQSQVFQFFEDQNIDYVFLCAAKVGGILANSTYPAEFIYDNLMIELNVMHASYLQGVKKLLFLGSSCVYPKACSQPIKEEYLLTLPLEKTNEAYALAKISGLKLCEYYNEQYGTCFISCMPTNMYGPNDNFHLQNSHVIPALIKKVHSAKKNQDPSVVVWGTGKPKREFLYVNDFAKACLFLMNNYEDNKTINVGCGKDIEISALIEVIKEVVGYEGEIVYDVSKPDGTPRKLLCCDRLFSLGWRPENTLRQGLKKTYAWFLDQEETLKEK